MPSQKGNYCVGRIAGFCCCRFQWGGFYLSEPVGMLPGIRWLGSRPINLQSAVCLAGPKNACECGSPHLIRNAWAENSLCLMMVFQVMLWYYTITTSILSSLLILGWVRESTIISQREVLWTILSDLEVQPLELPKSSSLSACTTSQDGPAVHHGLGHHTPRCCG
jgi:hypothetical protein